MAGHIPYRQTVCLPHTKTTYYMIVSEISLLYYYIEAKPANKLQEYLLSLSLCICS